MKNKILFFIAISGILISCNHAKKNIEEEESVLPNTTSEIPLTELNTSECYLYTFDKDTVTLHLNSNDTIITGQLTYKIYEKDKNSGTFTGHFEEDILIADYTFESEGKPSVRQIAFKQKGDTLIEGYGDMEEKNGKFVFKDLKSIRFNNNNIVLKIVDCLE